MDDVNWGLRAADSLPDGTFIVGDYGGKVRNILPATDRGDTKLSGRDQWIENLTHAMDAEPELDEDQEAEEIGHRGDDSSADKLEGRALWLSRLSHMMEESDRLHQQRMNYRDGQTYWRRDGRVAA